MSSRIRGVDAYQRRLLSGGWEMCSTPPGACDHPASLAPGLQWTPFTAPATAASALRAAGAWSLDSTPRRFDAEDWWFRTRFSTPEPEADGQFVLGFDGIATVADAWLDGEPLLVSESMFAAHERIIGNGRHDHDLVIRCRSLDAAMNARRARPRWKTPMIENQQLRWFRTTLLGRTPGWSPPAAAVGPWRAVWVEHRKAIAIENIALNCHVENDVGRVSFSAKVTSLDGDEVGTSELIVQHEGQQQRAPLMLDPASQQWRAVLNVEHPQLWWPHTHGEPVLYKARVRISRRAGPDIVIDLGHVGFRSVTITTTNGGFSVHVNGVRVFCRGTCWTPDPVTLDRPEAGYRATLDRVKAAGMNMLRIGGTMVYEHDAFFDLCDELGIMLWQDFMFANMDYPEDDASFMERVQLEARQQLTRFGGRPCLAVLCGNSEGEQQAAMFGATRERWSPRLFHEVLPLIAQEHCPDVPYWPSSAHGGSFPHQVNVGTTSYYGVGAYLRPLEDARRSAVRFATECLAFANVPEDASIARMPGGLSLRVHHPQWKARTPRDLGAGWDFEDVRDFYLELLSGIDPLQLRYSDYDRYIWLSRIVPGEVMAATYNEWRRGQSACNGALIWFLQDLWYGAGWGVLDADGMPKAPYYYLRRALQPLSVSISDEGCSGLAIHVINDGAQAFAGTLDLTLYRYGEIPVVNGRKVLNVAAHANQEISAVELFDGFLDTSYAFRFGPPSHDLAVAALSSPEGERVSEAFYLPLGFNRARDTALGLVAHLHKQANGALEIAVHTQRFAQAIRIDAEGFLPEDNYFHLAPGIERRVRLMPQAATKVFRGTIAALNGGGPVNIESAVAAPAKD